MNFDKAVSLVALFAIILIAAYGVMFHPDGSVQASASYGASVIGYIAPTVDQCPKSMKKFAMLCPVGSNGSFSMYVSYDGGAYQQLP